MGAVACNRAKRERLDWFGPVTQAISGTAIGRCRCKHWRHCLTSRAFATFHCRRVLRWLKPDRRRSNSIDLDPELQDWSDTAAAISQLDLVICVDTAVAHVAGAMGKPVWVMLPRNADWRWLLDRDDSPWYPTMRLFRQSRHGDWDEVVSRVKASLKAWVDGAAPTTMPMAQLVRRDPYCHARGVTTKCRPGLSAVAETRFGILQYLPDNALLGESLLWYGEYLQLQLDLLARLIPEGATLFEVQAGVGVHSVFLARLVGMSGHLYRLRIAPDFAQDLGAKSDRQPR